MKVIVRTAPGAVGLNYMWLPTFVGMNTALVREIEEHVAPFLVGKELTDEVLDVAGDAAIDFLAKKFPSVSGIFEYLEGLKYVESHAESERQGSAGAQQEEEPAAPARV
jgi:hypothetical protein